jgi:protein TonB
MGLVFAMHVGIFYLIANSLGLVPPITTTVPIDARFIDEPQTPPPQPRNNLPVPPAPNTVTLRDPELPPIVIDPPETITAPAADEVGPPPTGETFQGPVIVDVRQDARHPLSQPPYPPAEIRAGNTGTADIEVYVLPSGRVGDARIVKSTGFNALDQSALAEAKRNWRLTPATRDGVPIAQWHRLRVTFRLNRQ